MRMGRDINTNVNQIKEEEKLKVIKEESKIVEVENSTNKELAIKSSERDFSQINIINQGVHNAYSEAVLVGDGLDFAPKQNDILFGDNPKIKATVNSQGNSVDIMYSKFGVSEKMIKNNKYKQWNPIEISQNKNEFGEEYIKEYCNIQNYGILEIDLQENWNDEEEVEKEEYNEGVNDNNDLEEIEHNNEEHNEEINNNHLNDDYNEHYEPESNLKHSQNKEEDLTEFINNIVEQNKNDDKTKKKDNENNQNVNSIPGNAKKDNFADDFDDDFDD